MDIIKSPQDNIEAYLYNEINIELYREESFDESEMLSFFNLLFKEFEFFCENKNNYLSIINHFKEDDYYNTAEFYHILNNKNSDKFEKQREKLANSFFLYDYLDRLIKDKYPEIKRTGVLLKTSEYIEKMSNMFEDYYMDGIPVINNFGRLQNTIESLSNEEKLIELVKYKHRFLISPGSFQKSIGRSFDVQCDLEIQKINEVIKYETNRPRQKEIINESEPEQKTPYKIALLHELGFFKLDAIKKLTKENQYKIIKDITGGSIRTIKGNVLVLDTNSNEDRIKYTSNNYTDEVKIYLDKLK